MVFLLYVAGFTGAALACFVSLPRLARIDDVDTRRGIQALLLTSGGWAAAHVAFLTAPTQGLKLGSYTVGLVLGLAAVGAWLYFCSAYTGRIYHRSQTYRRLGLVVFLVLVVVKVTNPLHHEYYTTTTVATPFPHLSVYAGPLHWVAMALSYALAFVGYFMLLELFTKIDLDTRPLLGLVSITALPVGLDILGYTTPILIDITYEPLGVAVFAVGVAFVYRERFEAVQLAGERDTPVIAVDAADRIRDTNRMARTVFPELGTARGTQLAETLPTVADCLGSDDPVLRSQQAGNSRYYQITDSPYGTGKSGLGRTIVFTDVTERERYRTELERQNERLERFASVVSHDLRNPLSVAHAYAQTALDEDDVSFVEQTLVSLDRMDDLIGDLLVLAREGQPVDAVAEVSIAEMARRAWRQVETTDATLVVETDATVTANDRRLQQLFENLFRNAVEHGGPDVTVTVGTTDDRSGFFVADDGPGIPVEDRERVFEYGYTSSRDSTGFGLAIVSGIVAAHEWKVRVTDSEAGGARFEITSVKRIE